MQGNLLSLFPGLVCADRGVRERPAGQPDGGPGERRVVVVGQAAAPAAAIPIVAEPPAAADEFREVDFDALLGGILSIPTAVALAE